MTYKRYTCEDFAIAFDQNLVNAIQDTLIQSDQPKFTCMASLMLVISLGLLDDDEVTRDAFIHAMPEIVRISIPALRVATSRKKL